MYYNTITAELKQILEKLMQIPVLNSFRLVGGTSLSLQLGHRESVDIDLFTDEMYSSINFQTIDESLKLMFTNIGWTEGIVAGMGKSYNITMNDETIKVDVFYSGEKYIQPILLRDKIRMATVEEIIAMKLEVVANGGRKKDFWDLHELIGNYTLQDMLNLHEERYPYTHNAELIKHNFTQFEKADRDFNPVCLRGKHWELIKMDLVEFVGGVIFN